MKLRLIVMNGQRIVETEEDGVWKCIEVGKARKLKTRNLQTLSVTATR